MGNLFIGLKKFLQNKNIVTIVGIILVIAILYFAYTIRVNSAINPITVPYATKTILSATQITKDMVATRQVPPSMLEGRVITTVADVVDKYVAIDTVIPEGSLFYKGAVVEREQLPDDIILDYADGYELFSFDVGITTAFGSMIYPSSYIDVRLTIKKDGRIITGNLLSNIKVLAVKDAYGKSVYQNIEERRTPEVIVVALKEDNFKLMAAIKKLNGVTYELIPKGSGDFEDVGETELSSDELRNWISRHVEYK
jgi:hypothetical protein